MITAEDFVLELNATEESKNFKLATVTSLFTNKTAKVQFDGEETPSEKQYAYLESYTPKTLDRVLLAVTGGTYVILGKVNYNISPPTEAELDRYLFDEKLVTMTKGLSVTDNTTLNNALTVSGLASLNGGASISGNLGINGVLTATGLSTSGNLIVSGTSTFTGVASFTDAPSFNSGFNSTADYYSNIKYLKATQLLHTGNALGFFGRSATSKRVIYKLTGTGTVQGNFNAINSIIGALQEYGLF